MANDSSGSRSPDSDLDLMKASRSRSPNNNLELMRSSRSRSPDDSLGLVTHLGSRSLNNLELWLNKDRNGNLKAKGLTSTNSRN